MSNSKKLVLSTSQRPQGLPCDYCWVKLPWKRANRHLFPWKSGPKIGRCLGRSEDQMHLWSFSTAPHSGWTRRWWWPYPRAHRPQHEPLQPLQQTHERKAREAHGRHPHAWGLHKIGAKQQEIIKRRFWVGIWISKNSWKTPQYWRRPYRTLTD